MPPWALSSWHSSVDRGRRESLTIRTARKLPTATATIPAAAAANNQSNRRPWHLRKTYLHHHHRRRRSDHGRPMHRRNTFLSNTRLQTVLVAMTVTIKTLAPLAIHWEVRLPPILNMSTRQRHPWVECGCLETTRKRPVREKKKRQTSLSRWNSQSKREEMGKDIFQLQKEHLNRNQICTRNLGSRIVSRNQISYVCTLEPKLRAMSRASTTTHAALFLSDFHGGRTGH